MSEHNAAAMEQVGEHTFRSPDMSLRDWFAGMAIMAVGCLADRFGEGNVVDEDNWSRALAKLSYEMADAMLAARERAEPDLIETSKWKPGSWPF
jgi:hypothetical protein